MKKWLHRIVGILLVALLLIQGDSYRAAAQPAVVAHGLDVSQWQGDIDWEQVAGTGISFVMFGLGRYQQPDPRFEENISEATACGIRAGAYLRSQASTVEMARAEARYVVEQIQGYPISMPVAYDIEDEPQMNLPDNASRTELVLAFCQEIREAGYYSMVYANEYWLGSLLDVERIREAGIDIWQARYGSSYDESYGASMWQYSSTGSVEGISVNVDQNYLFKDYTSLIPVRTEAEASWLEEHAAEKEEDTSQEKEPLPAPASGSWQQNQTGWWYRNADGSYPAACWQKIDGSWYYFNSAGYMLTGWQYIGNTWYYLDGSGHMLTGWQQIGGSWYYLDGSGHMLTGWQWIGGSWYYLNGSGHMLTGWIELDNTWYYLYSNGAMASGCYVGSYYVNESGAWVA